MNFLNVNELQFIQKENECLNLVYQQKEYTAVKLYYCFPLKEPNRYISVRYGEEEKELGIIENLTALSKENQRIVMASLSFRYFIPEIIKIYHHRYQRPAHHFDVETTSGRKKIMVTDIVWNIFKTPDHCIMIQDTDGNYYLLKEYLKHPDKYIKLIKNYL